MDWIFGWLRLGPGLAIRRGEGVGRGEDGEGRYPGPLWFRFQPGRLGSLAGVELELALYTVVLGSCPGVIGFWCFLLFLLIGTS